MSELLNTTVNNFHYLKSTPVSSLFPVLVKANPVFGTASIVKVHPDSPTTSSDRVNLNIRLSQLKAIFKFSLLVLHTSLHLANKIPFGSDEVKAGVFLLPGDQH